MEGLVTANGNFRILPDGSIEAKNGKFGGEVNAETGYIGGFAISGNHIGVSSRVLQPDGSYKVVDDRDGLFLYDTMIGFNAKDRQAIFGTWHSLGQPMLTRLVDTATDYTDSNGKKWGFLPKYGIIFDIENSMSGNFAFAGKGSGALNGFVDGFRFDKVKVDKANTIYDVEIKDSNRLIVACTAGNSGIALPRLPAMRSTLGIGQNTPFAFRLTVSSDLGAGDFVIFGRNKTKNSKQETPWNKEDYPLLTTWNGEQWGDMTMGQGDTVELLLVYDPERTVQIDGFTTQYTARIINRQN